MKDVKNLLNKFRRWLIKKLGGYTTQYNSSYSNHVTVEEHAIMNTFDYMDPKYETSFKENLVYQLAERLYKEGYIDFKKTEMAEYDPATTQMIIASIKVLPKENYRGVERDEWGTLPIWAGKGSDIKVPCHYVHV